jgi:hypothetical protein
MDPLLPPLPFVAFARRVATVFALLMIALVCTSEAQTTFSERSMPGTEVEPNNTANLADPIGRNDYVTGAINPVRDVDYFYFDASAGETFDVLAAATGSGPLLDGALWIYRSNGTLIAENDDMNGDVTRSRVQFTTPTAGRYYIRYAHWTNSGSFPNAPVGPDGPDGSAGKAGALAETGPYRITLTVSNCTSNDHACGAILFTRSSGTLSVGGTGSINPAGDVDYWAFDASVGEFITITAAATSSPPLDGALWIYTSNGTLIAENDDMNGDVTRSRVQFTTPTAGRYYIRYAHFANSGSFPNAPAGTENAKRTLSETGDYRLDVTFGSSPTTPPVLSVSVTTPQAAGNEFWVDVNVGSTSIPVSNLFGLSFVLNFTHTMYVDVVTPYSSTVLAGPFMGSAPIFLAQPNEAAGQVSIGLSRRQGEGGVTGSGNVVRIRFRTMASTPSGTAVTFSLSSIQASTSTGSTIALQTQGATVTVQSGLTVWPGDTNNDRVVNQADVLPIGLHWARTGPARGGASMGWSGQSAQPWTIATSTYADANGDGTVNQADVLPIGLNWARTNGTIRVDDEPPAASQGQAGTLRLVEVPGAVEVRGEGLSPLFGISFEITYAAAGTTAGSLVPGAPEQGTLLGNDVLFLPQTNRASGVISVGISRKAGQGNVSGSGLIARIPFSYRGRTAMGLRNVTANDENGTSVALTVASGISVAAEDDPTTPMAFALHAPSPNPARGPVIVSFDLPEAGPAQIAVFDALGRLIQTLVDGTHASGRHTAHFDADALPAGLYLLRLSASNGTVRTQRLTVAR